MKSMIRVFCSGDRQKECARTVDVVERYPGFLIARGSPATLRALRREYLAEDITPLYTVIVAGKVIGDLANTPRTFRRAGSQDRRSSSHYYLVQFVGPIKQQWLRIIRRCGGIPAAPYQNFTYIIRLDAASLRKAAGLSCVRWIVHFPPAARIATALRYSGRKTRESALLPRARMLRSAFSVEFFETAALLRASAALRRAGVEDLAPDAKGKIIGVTITGTVRRQRRVIAAISRIHGVRSIRARSLQRTSNDVAAGIMGTAVSLDPGTLHLSGSGEIVGICDTGLDSGDPAHLHPDFGSRVKSLRSYPISPDFTPYVTNPGGDDGPADLDSGHGTHVAGSVLGNSAAGISSSPRGRPIRGLAYNAKLVFQAVEQELKWKDPADRDRYGRFLLAGFPPDLKTLFLDAYAQGARIHSNSWGGGDAGAYDTQCQQLDQFVWDHRDFCILVAAGNDGTDKDGDGKINLMSVTSPGTAKNCITVGASENKRPAFAQDTYGGWWPQDYPAAPYRGDPMADDPAEVAAFSSRGPTLDNRIKPDVLAPGTFILSTRSRMIAPNNKGWSAFPASTLYFFMGGTSMATPLTAGAVALLREYLRSALHISRPSAALLKAALILGATRLPANTSAVYDYHQGFGLVNLDAVLAPPKPARVVIRDMQPGLRTGQTATFTLRVTSSSIPLRVVMAYTDYPGRSLVNNLNLVMRDPGGKIFPGNGGTGPDNRNNVEVVQVNRPAQGSWEMQVIGSNVPEGPQEYALAYGGGLK